MRASHAAPESSPAERSIGGGASLALASGVFLGLALFACLPVLECAGSCFVDLDAVFASGAGRAGLFDIRLNTWILASIQDNLVSRPLDLFGARAFHPASDPLAGSEHMIGLAVLTLPLRLFTSNAILVYQATWMLTSVLLALTTFALVRWLTGSFGVAILGGAMAMLMPWRTSELAHLQLLGAHWFPLLWLLTLRILLGADARRDAILLALVLSLQLLTSYYLAYMLTVSLGVLVVAVPIQVGVGRRALGKLAAAALLPFALLVAVSMPYLARRGRGELPSFLDPAFVETYGAIAPAWSSIAPRFDVTWGQPIRLDNLYGVPLAVALLAILALLLPSKRHDGRCDALRSARAVIRSLWLCAACAFVLMLGSQLDVDGFEVKLPGHWASQLVPGFSALRAPHRWGILIGIAMPVLAALGVRRLAELLPERRGARRWRVAALGPLVVLILIGLPWRRLQAVPVWENPQALKASYAALSRLPQGPVVEVPWLPESLRYLEFDSLSMLATTLHHHPILNGFTAYTPAPFELLRRIGSRLPDRDALGKLVRLTELRWILVHLDRLDESKQVAWQRAGERADLRRAYADERTLIYEVRSGVEPGEWMRRVASTASRATTLSGLPRGPLALSRSAGHIELAAEQAPRFRGRMPRPIEILVANASARDWPGLDYQREGLVELRYVFVRDDGVLGGWDTAPLDADVPAGETVRAFPLITPPEKRGRFRLCMDLVQRLGDALVPLPIASIHSEVGVVLREWPENEQLAGLRAAAPRRRGLRSEDAPRCTPPGRR
jgi:hypothetical protein